MKKNVRILILEDMASDVELMEDELRSAGLNFISHIVSNRKDYLNALDIFSPDIILSDYDLPQYNGMLALKEARLKIPDVPFILVTGAIDEDQAINIFINGADDYVMKNRLQRLVPAVQRVQDEAKEIRARKKAEASLRKAHAELELRVKQRTTELQHEVEERKRTEESLREALSKIKTLSGLLPICASCKKIRDQDGGWVDVETYIKNNSTADFTHGVCPECAMTLYPELFNKIH